MSIEFTFDMDKTREALAYLASESPGGLDTYTACKLLFLADKYHLVRYGRTITGDRYFAMEHGPAPSRTLGLLQLVIEEPGSIPALESVLSVNRSFRYPRFCATKGIEFDNLSQSDIEALSETLKRFGSKTFPELRVLTHDMKAYQDAWDRRGGAESVRMMFEDFFEEDSDAIEGILEEAIENSDIWQISQRR